MSGTKVNQCALLKPFTIIEKRQEKKKIDTRSFYKSINIPKELITHINDENRKTKARYRKCNVKSTKFETVDTSVSNATT